MSKILTFVWSHESVFESTKQESSILGMRKRDSDGKDLFEELVLDEAYPIKFRELFMEARAEVSDALSAFTRNIPNDMGYFDEYDHSQHRDFKLWLEVSDDWNDNLTTSVDVKLREYIVAYIMYRWLEMKLPQEAMMYHERATSVLARTKGLLNRPTTVIRRQHRWI